MPELPEVETTLRGISPHILDRQVSDVVIRQPKLRWPVTDGLSEQLKQNRLLALRRRGKYLLFTFGQANQTSGTLLLHLGMSGSLRILPADTAPGPHDHVDLVFEHDRLMRLRDPRRFSVVLWTSQDPEQHKLIQHLGPEPLSSAFTPEHLYQAGRRRRIAVKAMLMNHQIVVGVGNIYASESLFRAGIHPKRSANRISLVRYRLLHQAVVDVLNEAISQGGTTLRDFQQNDGKPGYFAQSLQVYGRAGQACNQCGEEIKQIVLAQRSSYYCPQCQR